ncbi:MAG: AI-2E family transporter [Gammaproteobacteria bacterium]|nr:MAG: AI-2E family transporter [Gammaproteobacteria bacterium]
MLKIVRNWIHKYFSDEEAIVLFLLMAAGLAAILLLGPMLKPVLAAVVIAYTLQGLVSRLEQWRVPHLLSVILVFILFLTVTLSFTLGLLPQVSRQTSALIQEMPAMLADLKVWISQLPQAHPQFISQNLVDELVRQLTSTVTSMTQEIVSFSVTHILSGIPAFIGFLIYAILVPILVFFFLKDRELIVSSLTALLPKQRTLMKQVWAEANAQFANYIRGKVVEIIVVGAATWVAFAVMGLNYAVLLSILVGLSVVIPYIGAAVVTVPVALIGLFQFGWTPDFFWVLALHLIIQGLDGNVLVPLLFSEVVNLHPVVIIIAVLLFGGLWGLWGVFFAIPLATLIKAVIRAWPVNPSGQAADSP